MDDRISALPDDVDRISALPDDLLHVILGFLPDAVAASRTASLSRRWRRVWIHAQGLSFVETEGRCDTVPWWRHGHAPLLSSTEAADEATRCRFASFVAWVLAQRGDAEMRSLKIDMKRSLCASSARANEWILYAMQHVVESFCLLVPNMWPNQYRTNPPAIQLPSHGRATSIRMHLSDYRFRLPMAAAARYEALTELSISNATFIEEEEAPGSGRTLGDFVSSCCPRLRRLEIGSPSGVSQLVIRAEALEELLLPSAQGLRMLDVSAPKLRVLRVQFCAPKVYATGYGSVSYDNATIRIVVRVTAAPLLQEIGICASPHYYGRPALDVHDLTGVRRLVDLHLDMHGQYCRDTDVGWSLSEKCPRVEHISASLGHYVPYFSNKIGTVTASELVHLAPDGAAPFAMVTSIDLEACIFPRHHLVTSISSLLSRCPRLRLLCIKLIDKDPDKLPRKCICSDLNAGRSQKKFFLEYLAEVKINSFTGAREEIDLARSLFECSKSIESVTLSASKEMTCDASLLKLMGEEEDDMDTIDQELLKIPCTDQGRWQFEEDVYTWTCYAMENTTI